MHNPFHPPSLYQNYQPPPQGSDLLMPVPGWGWPANSAGERRVGVGALGETYPVTLPLIGKTSVDLPVSQITADAVNTAVPLLGQQLPQLIEQSTAQIRMTVIQGAVVAAGIAAVAIFGYKYLTGK